MKLKQFLAGVLAGALAIAAVPFAAGAADDAKSLEKVVKMGDEVAYTTILTYEWNLDFTSGWTFGGAITATQPTASTISSWIAASDGGVYISPAFITVGDLKLNGQTGTSSGGTLSWVAGAIGKTGIIPESSLGSAKFTLDVELAPRGQYQSYSSSSHRIVDLKFDISAPNAKKKVWAINSDLADDNIKIADNLTDGKLGGKYVNLNYDLTGPVYKNNGDSTYTVLLNPDNTVTFPLTAGNPTYGGTWSIVTTDPGSLATSVTGNGALLYALEAASSSTASADPATPANIAATEQPTQLVPTQSTVTANTLQPGSWLVCKSSGYVAPANTNVSLAGRQSFIFDKATFTDANFASNLGAANQFNGMGTNYSIPKATNDKAWSTDYVYLQTEVWTTTEMSEIKSFCKNGALLTFDFTLIDEVQNVGDPTGAALGVGDNKGLEKSASDKTWLFTLLTTKHVGNNPFTKIDWVSDAKGTHVIMTTTDEVFFNSDFDWNVVRMGLFGYNGVRGVAKEVKITINPELNQGIFTVTDALNALKLANKVTKVDSTNKTYDINGNGVIDVSDALAILKSTLPKTS